MRKLILIIVAALFAIVSVAPAFAFEKGNERKGKYTYRKVYQACNDRGAIESAKPAVNPDDKTQSQWTRIFEKSDFAGTFGCEEEWKALSQDDLADIYAYLHDHAADSPSPAKCK